MHGALFGKSTCGAGYLKAEPDSLRSGSPVEFVAQVLLEFGWQLETVSERLQQENPKLAQRLGERRKESLAR